MAENSKKRKSTRSFNLEKPVERHFDIEKNDVGAVEPKAPVAPVSVKVDNKPKEDKPVKSGNTVVQNNVPVQDSLVNNQEETQDNGKGGKGKWAAAIAGVLLAGGLTYFIATSDNSGEASPDETVVVAPDTTVSSTDDSTSLASVTPGEGTVTESGSELSENSAPGDAQLGTDSETPTTGNEGVGGKKNDSPSSSNSTPSTPTAANSNTGTPSGSGNNSVVSKPSNNPKSQTNVGINTSSNTNVAGNGTVEEEALKVLQGAYGNNPERRRILGANYEAIQKRVNEMYRKGLVH